MKVSDDEIFNCGVCQSCFIKLNELDEHLSMANKIQEDLTQLYEERNMSLAIKTEIKDEDHLFESIIANEPYEEVKDDQSEFDVYDDDDLTTEIRVKRPYRRKKNLDEGLIVVNLDGVKIYQCDVCKKLCKDRYKLKAHRGIHTTERRICCNECGAL